MKKTDAEAFAKKLIKRGYRRFDNAKYGSEDYDVSHLFKDEIDNDLYQIIYRFWDWTKYQWAEREFSIDLVIMPCFDGRADLEFSQFGGKVLDVDWVENLAKEYYEFITEKVK